MNYGQFLNMVPEFYLVCILLVVFFMDFFFHLSIATRQAIGTEAVSNPRKNSRNEPLLTMINIPSSVESISR